MINLLWLLLGLALLTLGGETVVRSALAVARRLGLSPLLAGLVIVGLGTSAPELVIFIKAALNAQPDIALGNAIGSNIANILLILGISTLIMPLHSHLRCLKRNGLSLLVTTVVFMELASFDGLSRLDGLMMIVLLTAYLTLSYRTEKADAHATEMHHHNAEVIPIEPMSLGCSCLLMHVFVCSATLGTSAPRSDSINNYFNFALLCFALLCFALLCFAHNC